MELNSKIDELTNKLKILNTKETIFVLDQDLNTTNTKFITSIKINFLQLWSIFNTTLPYVYKNDKCKYEWKIAGRDGTIFSIYDWNNNKKLLQTTEWHISSNVVDPIYINEFMENLCDALECYNTYYKCMEKNIFEDENPIVDSSLKIIKYELLKNKEILKTL